MALPHTRDTARAIQVLYPSMPLHPTIQAIHDAIVNAPNHRPTHEQTPEQARASYRLLATAFGPGQPVAEVEDRSIAGPGGELRVRIYRHSSERPSPALLYLHGGGWVIGDLESHDRECRVLCNDGHCTVVSVDYRLAPEHPAPAAVEDAWAALRWLSGAADELGIDRERIAIGGDSAGGALAAGTAIRARDAGGPALAAQLLIYPAVATHIGAFPSHTTNADTPFLPMTVMRWFRGQYHGSVDKVLTDPLLAPILADVSGLPPTLLITAEFDPLHDEGVAYADKLARAGVRVRHVDLAGMSHAFLHLHPILDEGKQALAELSAMLRETWSRKR